MVLSDEHFMKVPSISSDGNSWFLVMSSHEQPG